MNVADLESAARTASSSRKALWAGRLISALSVLFMLFDGVIKVMTVAPVVEAFARLGYPVSTALDIGILELVCTVVYVIPRTSLLGAILLTGFLGGATATHVRVGSPFFFPLVVGVLVWGGLFLREERLRALVPFRR